jgi:hypothetical protein
MNESNQRRHLLLVHIPKRRHFSGPSISDHRTNLVSMHILLNECGGHQVGSAFASSRIAPMAEGALRREQAFPGLHFLGRRW